MHKLELYLNDDEYERLIILQMYLFARTKELFPRIDVSADPFDFILKLGVFDGLIDLSGLKDPEKIAEMKEYLSRTEEKRI